MREATAAGCRAVAHAAAVLGGGSYSQRGKGSPAMKVPVEEPRLVVAVADHGDDARSSG
jgi:hypothetical protein